MVSKTQNKNAPASAAASHLDFRPWPAPKAALYRETGVWKDRSLAQAIFEQAQQRPSTDAIIDRQQRWTYRELVQDAMHLAQQLQDQGMGAGQYVVCHLPNCGEFFVLNLAFWICGMVPIMAVASHRQREIQAYIEQSHAVAYFGSDADFARSLESSYESSCESKLRRYVLSGTAPKQGLAPLHGFKSFENLDACPGLALDTVAPPLDPAEGPPKLAHPDALALLQLSGGSTGTPKLIPRTHNDYLYSVEQSVGCCGFGPETRYLAVLPLSHNFCLSSPGTLGVLISGGTVVVSSSPQASLAFAQINEHKVNATAVVPSIARMWSQFAQQSSSELHTLRDLWIGGGPLDPCTAQVTEESLGAKVHQVYGMAEGLVCHTPLHAPPSVRWHCQGSPLSPLDELQILNDQGEPCKPGEVGELWTQGPYTIRGYFRSPQHNTVAFGPQGHYKTGDLVRLRDDGHLVVSGRVKQQINRGGEKIASVEVEGLLRLHPKVLDVAVVGLPDPILGEKSCAVVIWEGTETLAELTKTLRRFLKHQKAALFKIPDTFVRQDQIPHSRLGKVDRPALRSALIASLPSKPNLAPRVPPASPPI